MENNEQELLKKELVKKDKTIWTAMWVILATSVLAFFAGLCLATFLIPEGIWQTVAVIGISVLFTLPCFYALKLEVSVGAYKCKNCGHEMKPGYAEAMWAMHSGTTRYLKCPKCSRRTWCKKVLTKTEE